MEIKEPTRIEKARLVLAAVCQRMKRKYESRDRVRAAELKRKRKAAKRVKEPDRYFTSLGLVDDQDYGPKPVFFQKGFFFKDGNGLHVLTDI